GFKNSEILGPLMAVWRATPHLGASPILRGVGDDKHLTKLCARARGVSTPDSAIYRYGSVPQDPPPFADGPMMVKPNASSASWGVKKCMNWDEAQSHMKALMAEADHHDVIIERFVDGIEMAVPVVPGADGMPAYLPVMIYDGEDLRLRTYQEKRFRESNTEWRVCDDTSLSDHILSEVKKLMPEIWPFDFGRFEFKYAPETGEFSFIELNMSCNLWSKKTVANSWRSLGYTHVELIETILTGSLLRQGVIAEAIRGDGS
ncbi:MAG: phosphoribosylglycinamide synthetase, partial [Pseudomonadota bacterium]